MQNRVAFVTASFATTFAALAATASLTSASAADWPEVKLSAKSAVPACTTPGRLMAMVKARNPALDARFETIAADYKRHGEALGVRWDYVFFQMLHETGDLTFKKLQRSVKPEQNNFAGLGAVNEGEGGESFADVSTGARAHIEHVMLYAGLPVDKPVAERTRKVQDWGVLKGFHQGLKSPATFGDVLGKWAPKSKTYADAIETAAASFAQDFCKTPDPAADTVAAVVMPKLGQPTKPIGAELAKKAIDDGKAEGNTTRAALGAGLAKANTPPVVKILNDPDAPSTPPLTPDTKAEAKTNLQTASAAAAGAKAAPVVSAQKSAEVPKTAGQKCRVWTASYGGDKALIIRSVTGELVNFTVLDVNPGQESREADAYISAYAKGGKVEAEFTNQAQALDRAFDLCPEG